MSKFSERLAELISERDLNEKAFAENSGVCASCVSFYLQEKSMPTVESLVKIADYCNCSTDFLLGREEENKSDKFKVCPPFCEQILFLKKHFNCSAYQIYHNTDIAKSCYYDWLSGSRQPNLDNIIRLAEHFDCSIDFILGREV